MTSALIKRYRKAGWVFESEDYTNHHNGNPETDYTIKSPRLEEPFTVHKPFDKLTLNELLAKEREAYAEQIVEAYDNVDAIQCATVEALKTHAKGKRLSVTVTLSLS